ncbi:MAG TPA: chemotaxis protein CheA [Verrucomicrobiae bacterium]|nr:chemotaxis protein CheA [Verrucomicrobiae bacterium]
MKAPFVPVNRRDEDKTHRPLKTNANERPAVETNSELKSLLDKIAAELIFAEPGKDAGLLPVNCLLGQIEELVGAQKAPEPLTLAVQQARRWVDNVFETSGTFSGPVLKQFGEWVVWCQAASQAVQNQSPLAALPDRWQAAAPPSSGVSAAVAAPAAAATEDSVIVLNVEQDKDLLVEFINESQEHLQNIEQGVLVLEDHPSDAETLNSIFRAFHTFKGGSGFLNLTPLRTLAHELESLLDLARQHKLSITPPIINVILAGGDTLKQFIEQIGAQVSGTKPLAPIDIPIGPLLASIRAVLAQDQTVAAVSSASAPVESRRGVAVPNQNPLPPAETANLQSGGSQTGTNGAARQNAGTSVKVDTLKLDSLIDLVGELVIAQSLVVQNQDLNSLQSEQLTRDLARLGRISKDLQRTAMSLRMVPIRATFQKMNRLVRDIAAKIGKQVQLVTEGEETELDRNIVEEISDPLIHMIRNSVDHGLERPEIRQQNGKPQQGTVTLKAFHQGGNIVIQIQDDGAGLNRERILAKAVEKGLARPGEQLSDSDVFKFILAAGFSTAEKVTDLSGRGVGMDVVRRNIEKLRGKIEISSVPGKGASFSIFLPLTLAIIDGLLVSVGKERYILPTLSISESFRPRPEMLSNVQGHGEMVNVRGKLRPLLRLYSHFGIEPTSTDPMSSIIVVVESGSGTRCVLVDHLLGKQEVVIKSLEENFRQNRSVAGAAILGDGRVGLILDPESLVRLDSSTLKEAA